MPAYNLHFPITGMFQLPNQMGTHITGNQNCMSPCFELTHACIPLSFLNTRKFLSDAIRGGGRGGKCEYGRSAYEGQSPYEGQSSFTYIPATHFISSSAEPWPSIR